MTSSLSSGGDRDRRPTGWARLGLPLVLAALLGGLVLSPAHADFSGPDWRYNKPITLPTELGPQGLVELAPDAEVYAGAAPGLADVRIVDDGGREVPYKLAVSVERHDRRTILATLRDLGHVPGQYTSFVADLGEAGVLHNEVEIGTVSQGFQREVTVEGSNDGAAWAVLQAGTRIFNFTVKERSFSAGNTRVRYPDSTVRYLRVRIDNGAEPPLDVGRAIVYSGQDTPARETDYPAVITGRTEDKAFRQSQLVVDLGSPGLPTSGLTIDTPQVNFYRGVALEAGDDGLVWRKVLGDAVVFAYDTPRFQGSQLAFKYPETAARYLRLIVYNEDNPPLPMAAVSVRGVARRLVFQAQAGAGYELFYGNPAARQPAYELERILPYLDTEDLPLAQVGPQRANPQFAVPQLPVSERLPWLVPAAVALAAVAVALLLLGVLRQAKKLLPPPAP